MVGLSFVLPVSCFFILRLKLVKTYLDSTNNNIYTYFLNNQLTVGHQALIFGLRELNSTEMNTFCSNQSVNINPPITDKPFNFTSNYQLRIFTSGCYYLDSNNNWQSDGLVVSFVLIRCFLEFYFVC
jgi:hypothetical protein